MTGGCTSRMAEWLRLGSIGPVKRRDFRRLWDRFGDPKKVLAAIERGSESEDGHRGLSEKALQNLENFDPEKEWLECAEHGVSLIPFDDPAYPPLLKELHNPPPLLYLRGEVQALTAPAVAVVGTRIPSEYGKKMARTLGAGLAARGITVVSGGARGIDTAAHLGALEVEGRTVAVLGSGIREIYPPENGEVFQRIKNSGALLTEFTLGTRPGKYTFPLRNRIITGLSLGVVVVEAPKDSGALLSAEAALDQNREVFAVPGRAGHPASWGPHDLIRRGAKLTETVDDILEELNLTLSPVGGESPNEGGPRLEGPLRQVYQTLSLDPLHVDEIARRCALSAAEVSVLLFELELEGLIRKIDGMRYVIS